MRHVLRISVLAAVVFMMMPTGAKAADLGGIGSFGIHPYIGMGFGGYNLKFSGAGYNQGRDAFGVMFKVGADFNKYLGAELRVATTDPGSGPSNLYAFYLFSYLAKLQYPITQELSIYGLAGATTGKVHFRPTGNIDYAGKVATGASFGGGIDFSVDEATSVGVEYMRYWNHVSINRAGSPPAKENAGSILATIKIAM